MTEEDPCFRDECPPGVLDYDYEVGLLERDQPEVAQERPPLGESQGRAPFSGRRHLPMLRIAFAIVVVMGITYVAGVLTGDHRQAAEPAPAPVSNDQPTWDDSLEPTTIPPLVPPRSIPTPSVSPEPAPEPLPSADPGATTTSCTDLPGSGLSYKAVAAIVMGPYGPMMPPSGYIGVAGPAGLPPVFVERERLNWWWNWRSGPNGCEYYLDRDRLN